MAQKIDKIFEKMVTIYGVPEQKPFSYKIGQFCPLKSDLEWT